MLNIFKGRLNRLRYLIYSLILSVLLGTGISASVVLQQTNISSAIFWAVSVMLIVLSILTVGIIVRRFHDVDKSGYYFFTMLIPIVNLYFALYLLLKPGDSQPNVYGLPKVTDPKSHYFLGTIVVLFFLIPLIAVLFYVFRPAAKISETPLVNESSSKSPSGAISSADLSDWKVYTDQKYGFELKYPKEGWVTGNETSNPRILFLLYSTSDSDGSSLKNKLAVTLADNPPVSTGRSGSFAGKDVYLSSPLLANHGIKSISFVESPFLTVSYMSENIDYQKVFDQVFSSFRFVGN